MTFQRRNAPPPIFVPDIAVSFSQLNQIGVTLKSESKGPLSGVFFVQSPALTATVSIPSGILSARLPTLQLNSTPFQFDQKQSQITEIGSTALQNTPKSTGADDRCVVPASLDATFSNSCNDAESEDSSDESFQTYDPNPELLDKVPDLVQYLPLQDKPTPTNCKFSQNSEKTPQEISCPAYQRDQTQQGSQFTIILTPQISTFTDSFENVPFQTDTTESSGQCPSFSSIQSPNSQTLFWQFLQFQAWQQQQQQLQFQRFQQQQAHYRVQLPVQSQANILFDTPAQPLQQLYPTPSEYFPHQSNVHQNFPVLNDGTIRPHLPIQAQTNSTPTQHNIQYTDISDLLNLQGPVGNQCTFPVSPSQNNCFATFLSASATSSPMTPLSLLEQQVLQPEKPEIINSRKISITPSTAQFLDSLERDSSFLPSSPPATLENSNNIMSEEYEFQLNSKRPYEEQKNCPAKRQKISLLDSEKTVAFNDSESYQPQIVSRLSSGLSIQNGTESILSRLMASPFAWHQIVHGPATRLQCKVVGCNERFRDAGDLLLHLASHRNASTRKHICPDRRCMFNIFGFQTIGQLRRHIRSVHRREARHEHQCQGCFRAFPRRDSLQRHISVCGGHKLVKQETKKKKVSTDVERASFNHRKDIMEARRLFLVMRNRQVLGDHRLFMIHKAAYSR